VDLLKEFWMRINRLIVIVGLGLFALLAAPAWAAGETGAKLCVGCHDEEDLPDMSGSPHANKTPPMGAAAEALASRLMGDVVNLHAPDCLSCHGPSLTHAKQPTDVKERPHPDRVFSRSYASSPSERSAVCLTCHDRDSKRAMWAGSPHAVADIACNSCHQVHTNRDKVLKKATQAEVCYKCHKEQRAQMNKPSHHPVPEGKMTCSDCHNVHGSAGPKLVKRDSTNATCYTCHAEKRGPFVHQHEPVAEDCANCHNPHGSTVPAMLKTRPPLLCQQCHTPHVAGGVGALAGQPGVSDQSANRGQSTVNMWQGRSCLNCHTQIHGSNNPSVSNPMPQLMLR
jgi:DmsE family decaheme c-type cytochrome